MPDLAWTDFANPRLNFQIKQYNKNMINAKYKKPLFASGGLTGIGTTRIWESLTWVRSMWLSQVWRWSFGLYIYIIKFKPSFFNRLEDQADTTRLLRIRLLIDNIFMKIIIIMTITHQWATWTRRWGEFWQSWRILDWLQILWWAPPYQHCKTMPFFTIITITVTFTIFSGCLSWRSRVSAWRAWRVRQVEQLWNL